MKTALKKYYSGFTLIELMVVIAVIAILATIALFGLGSAQKAARDTQRQQIMNGMRAALERYNGDTASYPAGALTAALNALSTGGQLTSNAVDPGCGAGKQTYPAASTLATGVWAPCGAGTGVTYSYTTGGGTYSLILNREGGGSNTFVSPQ